MVLWRKEVNGKGHSHVKLLPFDECDDRIIDGYIESMPHSGDGISLTKKDDNLATDFRNRGNDKFKMNQIVEAMELYNKCLQFSTEGSANISLAYANRSVCFFRMKHFKQCLADIELAKKSNYPERLMEKLNERQKACFSLMEPPNEAESTEKPTLDFDADPTFPCMANILEIQCNDEFGKHVVSKSDIEVGKVVSVEKAFHFNVSKSDTSFCETCVGYLKNFIACPKCSCVLFCDTNCMEANNIHQMTCGASHYRLLDSVFLVESIIVAVTAFPSVDELMSFVEAALSCRDTLNLPKCSSVKQSRYFLFLMLSVSPAELCFERMIKISGISHMILHVPEMRLRFNTRSKRRFLQHLIWHHMLIIETKTRHSATKHILPYTKPFQAEGYIQLIFGFSSLLNHSCVPNILFSRDADKYIGYIVRPVKKGEQLLASYINADTTPEKKKMVFEDLQIECKCSKCEPCFKQEDCIRMQFDFDYQFISAFDEKDMYDHLLRFILKGKCCKFLSEFGRLPWCKQIENVMSKFKEYMNWECY